MSACALHPIWENTWHISGRPPLSQESCKNPAQSVHVCVRVCVYVEGFVTNAKEISVVSKAPFGANIMG